jgi:putative MATE family efflux protein
MSNFLKYKEIWKVSYPIILGGVAQNIVNVTDTAFLARLDLISLGAAGNAGIFYFVLMVIGLGFSIGCQIIIGRRNGEKNYKMVGSLFNHGLLFLLPLAFILFVFVQWASPAILEQLTASRAIFIESKLYLSYRSYGIFFAFVNYLFIAFYTGITKTKVLTYATLLQALVNVLFDYLFIFGTFGFPKLGIQGAALASVLSELIALAFFVFYTKNKINYQQYGLTKVQRIEWQKMFKLIRISSPVMLQNFLALSAWLTFFMIIEQMGETELAISHIVRSVYMVMMIPLFGFSTATSTLVSNMIGERKLDDVTRLIKRIMILSFSATAIFLPFTLLIPDSISAIYTEDPQLISGAKPLYKVISAAMFLFSVAYVAFSAVTGTGKTNVSLLIESLSIGAYLFGAYLIAAKFELPLELVWCCEFIYFGIMGSFALLYLKHGAWRELKI